MKETIIELLYDTQITALIKELFEQIKIAYGIKDADKGMNMYFLNTIKKNYSFLNFEQIESAFERNANGLIDNYFQKIGQRPDNKIKSFNIPDLTKILNAYIKFKKIGRTEEKEKALTSTSKHEIFNSWLDKKIKLFENYKKKKKKETITLQLFTANFFARINLIDINDIDLKEKNINILSNKNICNHNENLIYKAFDYLIENNENLEQYFKYERNKYS